MVVKHYLDFLPDGFWSIQLDIVGFLAILGEASVLANSQVAAMSKTCLLPRLIPAPQALIRTSRPERLKTSTGTIIGFESGNVRRHINHIPHILHQVAFHEHKLGSAEMEDYAVRAIEIKWAPDLKEHERKISVAVDKATSKSKAGKNNNEQAKKGSWSRQWGPLVWLAYGGCAQSLALLLVSATQGDGMSLLAVILLSAVSSLVGLATHCELTLPSREADRDVPPSDVVISYPNGSLLIVKCPEDIARLYVQSEQCEYKIKSVWQYRVICLLASVLLMFGVIALANAQPLLQVIWAAAYIVLNAFYWIVAALPSRWHWDMTSFETSVQHYSWWQVVKHEDGRRELELQEKDAAKSKNFTEALWKAIAITKTQRWARIGEVAPNTSGWDNWLQEAMRNAKIHTDQTAAADDDVDSTEEEKAKQISHPTSVQRHPMTDLERQSGPKAKPLASANPPLMVLPKWDYNQALTRRLKEYGEARKRDSNHF